MLSLAVLLRGRLRREPLPGIHHQAGAVYLIAVFLGGPVLLADLDLLALGDSVSNLNNLGGQEIGLSLSRAYLWRESSWASSSARMPDSTSADRECEWTRTKYNPNL